MNEFDLAWAAGLFEGEGFIGFNRSTSDSEHRPRGYLTLELRMTDEDVVRRFASIVGVGSVNGPYLPKKGGKPFWGWRTSGTRAKPLTENDLFVGWLGERRKKRLAEVLTMVDGQVEARSRVKKTHCHRGHLFDEENTYLTPNGRRSCRACLRIARLAYYRRNKSCL